MTQQTEHLTETEISRYWEQDSGGGLDAERSRVEKHLEDCEPCLERLLHFQRTQLGLLESNLMSATPHPECPGDDILQEIAAGLASQEMAEYHTRHISMCDYCGPALKRYLHEFSTEPTPEDTALLAQLQTSTPKWQKEFVNKHVVSGAAGNKSVTWGKSRAFWSWPKLIGFGAAAAAMIAVITLSLSRFRSGNDNQLVAAVALERRTTAMRLPSVPYSEPHPLEPTLGSEGDQVSGFDRPKLLAAKAEVAKELESGANDPKVLQREGEVALLEGTLKAVTIAKKALEDARDAGLDSPRLQIDLAISNFEYEMKTNPQKPNLRKTIDLLQGIVDDPKLKSNDENRLVALFDLALAYQKSNLDARPIWEQYLQIDPSSPWASEARSHLDKLPRPKQQGKSEGNGSGNAETDLYTAVTLWLPDAVKQPEGGSQQRLSELADLMVNQHADFWLKDFLAALKPGSSQPVTELGAAVMANQQGRTADALQHARHAIAGFARQHNPPGELRAQYEEVYAYQRQLNGSACRSRAGPLAESLNSTRYPWLQSQTALENAICLNFLGNYSTIDDEIARSRKLAIQANYSTLLMRVLSIAAEIHLLNEKNCDKAWRDGVQGLQEYWTGNHPPQRLYQFYAVLGQCADQTQNYHAAEALIQQAILIKNDIATQNHSADNTIVRGMLHFYLGNILEALGNSAQAELEAQKASLVLETTKEPTVDGFKLAPRIRLAEIQMMHGKADIALSTLTPVKKFVDSTTDQFFEMDYYRVLGAIHFHLRHFQEAESAYQHGIVLAENSLAALKDASQRLQWTVKTEDLYKGLIRIWIEQDRHQDAWRLWEWYRSRSMIVGTGQLANGKSKIGWAALRQQILGSAVIPVAEDRLVYLTYDDGLEIWVIHEKIIKPHWISIDRHISERLVSRFVEVCTTGYSNLTTVKSIGHQLYAILFAPIIDDLQQQALTVELDRSLQNTMIEALPGPEGYVVQHFQVLYSPGVLVEKTLRKPMRIENNDLLVQLEGAGYVPGRESFRNQIGDLFPRSKTVQGTNSSLSQIQSALSISNVFNFIGHGEENGINTALRIKDKPDELLLQSGDIPKALHHLKLATLSACSTGTSNDNGLLDTGNLANSFLAAGVPNVVASRWNVASDSTQKLIESFYEHVRNGDNAVSALQKAQNELLKTSDHPYYWAGFYLAGRAN